MYSIKELNVKEHANTHINRFSSYLKNNFFREPISSKANHDCREDEGFHALKRHCISIAESTV